MEKKERKVRNHWVNVRMNEEEFTTLENNRKKTTERTNSNYLRKIATNEPVKMLMRNASQDDFTTEIIQLRKELNAIGQNFNQAVRKLHTLKMIPEFRTWIQTYEQTRREILSRADNICSSIEKNYR